MGSLKITKCKGEGQGSCKRCTDRGIWNRSWMCFLYEIEGYEGCYCLDCVKEMEREENSDLVSRKALVREINRLHVSITGLRAGKSITAKLMEEYRRMILGCIDELPTAYDTDAVCEELEEYLFDKYCIEGDGRIYDIVKKGGKKNDSTADF